MHLKQLQHTIKITLKLECKIYWGKNMFKTYFIFKTMTIKLEYKMLEATADC